MPRPDWMAVRLYGPIQPVIRSWPAQVKKELGALLTRLQKGESIGMPDVRPMPAVAAGAAEIRIADRAGSYRTFHLIHGDHGILVFHAFTKKSQKTPVREIEVGRARLGRFVRDLEDDNG